MARHGRAFPIKPLISKKPPAAAAGSTTFAETYVNTEQPYRSKPVPVPY